jgi:hypothetical protein
MAYAFRESTRDGLLLSIQQRRCPLKTTLLFHLDKLRKRCYGLWTDLGEKANAGLYPVVGHLQNRLGLGCQ